jgi:hypothetical protein
MTCDHVVIGARKWATHYDPMGGPAGVLYGFTWPIPGAERLSMAAVAPTWRLNILYDVAEIDLEDNPLAYPSRHVVDHE